MAPVMADQPSAVADSRPTAVRVLISMLKTTAPPPWFCPKLARARYPGLTPVTRKPCARSAGQTTPNANRRP